MSDQQVILDAVAKWIAEAFGGVVPFGLSIPVARKILGDKSRSSLYEAAGRGDLEFVKDGDKTLVLTNSVIRYLGRMRSTKIKATPPRKWGEPRRSKKSQAQSTQSQV
jgi:hypothetical protein